jgi:hypothetical protein
MITFAAFFIDIGKDDLDRIHSMPYASGVIVKEESCTYLATTLASCRAMHPGCRTVVLSDHRTQFPSDAGYEVFRCDGLDSAQLMYSRSTAWNKFLETAGTHVVFLDNDMLIQTNLEPIFASAFDAGLTYRNQDIWPINAGIQFFHRDRLTQGVCFLKKSLEVFGRKYHKTAAWGGDQDTLRDMTLGAEFSRTDIHLWRSQDGYELLMLPCAAYNFSTNADQMLGPYPGIPVLHFKGIRKNNMLQYWEQYLNPLRSMLTTA